MKKIIGLPLCFALVIGCIACNKSIVPSIISQGKNAVYDSTTFNYAYAEAIRCKLMGNTSDAIELFTECLKINPNSDGVYYNMSQLLLANGDVSKGKSYLHKALSIDGKNIWYLMMLGNIYYQNNQLDSAIIVYERAIDFFPDKDNLKITLADLYVDNYNFKKANDIYSVLEKDYGINESTTFGYINSLVGSGKLNEALAKAKLLVENYPEELSYRSVLAEIYNLMGDSETALTVYTSLIESHPNDPNVQVSLCEFLLSKNKFADLSALLNKVIVNHDIPVNEKILLTSRILDNGEYVKSQGETFLLSLIVLEKVGEGNDIVVLLRPDLLSKMNRYSEAAVLLEGIIEKNQNNYYAWESLLLSYLNLGEYDILEQKSEKCSKLFNRSFLAKILYATAASENEHYSVALDELRKAEILAGSSEEMLLQVLSLRADVYYKMKDYEKSFETFETAIDNNNQDVLILNNYAYYLAERDLNLKSAEKMAKQVIKNNPDNPTYLDTYGWVLYKRGKLNKSVKVFLNILNSNRDAVYYEHLGYVYKSKGNCSEAVSCWQKAISLDSDLKVLEEEIEKCIK